MIGERGRARAERVLDDTCVIDRATAGTWTPDGGLPDGADEVYSGPCALLAPQERRQSDGGGDDRLRVTRVLLLPIGADYEPHAADKVTVASVTDPVYVVESGGRSHQVLRRVPVASTLDAEGVPQ
jgi:hypothetical protein